LERLRLRRRNCGTALLRHFEWHQMNGSNQEAPPRQDGTAGGWSRAWRLWGEWLVPLAVLGLGFALFAGKATQYTHVHDSVLYASGAQGIASGSGYVLPIYEGSPRAGLYPPLQSMLLSVGWDPDLPYSRNKPRLAVVSGILTILALLVCHRFWRIAGIPTAGAALILSVLTFHEAATVGTLALTADIGFAGLLCGICAMWWRGGCQPSPWPWLLTGIGLALALIWRTAALAIAGGAVIAAMAVAWRSRRWRPMVLLSTPILAMLLYSLQQPWGPAGYVSVAHQLGASTSAGMIPKVLEGCILLGNGTSLLRAISPGLRIAQEVISRQGPWISAAIATAMGGGVWMAGWMAVRGFRSQTGGFRWVLLGICSLYVVQILMTPWGTIYHGRYLLPVVAVMMPWVVRGLTVGRPCGLRIVALFLGMGFCVLAASLNAYHSRIKFQEHQRTTNREGLLTALQAMRGELPAGTRLAVSIGAPVLDVVEMLGRPVLPDYIRPSVDLREATYHRAMGYPRADYLVSRDSPEGDPPGLLAPQGVPVRNPYRILRIDPASEAGFRQQRGMPPQP